MLFSFFLTITLLAGPLATFARPTTLKRGSNFGKGNIDQVVVQFARTLETLERQFYDQGLGKFQVKDIEKGFEIEEVLAKEIFATLEGFRNDEAAHEAFLTGAIQGAGLDVFAETCKFEFGSALDNLYKFLDTARAAEEIGVGAYSGSSPLIKDPSLLVSAASILPIEARHQSILNGLTGGTLSPQAFDIPLSPESVSSLVSHLIASGCDFENGLGITPQKPLVVSFKDEVLKSGSKLEFKIHDKPVHDGFCVIVTGETPIGKPQAVKDCTVPEIDGPFFVFLLLEDKPFVVDPVKQDKANILAGPQLLFVDPPHEGKMHAARTFTRHVEHSLE